MNDSKIRQVKKYILCNKRLIVFDVIKLILKVVHYTSI